MKTRPTSGPIFASLFSGCGGFDIGFTNVGFTPSAAFDIDQAIIDNYNDNLLPVARRCDLSKEMPLSLLKHADVLLAGSPCQGFSTVGKRVVSDPRNRLASRAGEIARAIRPKVFVLENVPAALSGQHAQHWEEVECGLKADGYNVRRFICEGKHSGVAQKRRRLFLIAWLGSDCIRIEPDASPSISLAETLSGVEDLPDYDPEFLTPGSKDYLIAQSIRQGQKLCNVRAASTAVHTWDIPAVFGGVTPLERSFLDALVSLRRRNRRRDFGDADPVNASDLSLHLERDVSADVQSLLTKGYIREVAPGVIDLRHTFNGKYRRLSLADNSPTVDTRFGDHRLFLHPTEHRPLTAREAARIQGFPDSYRFVGSRQKKYTMIGNAVPPPMAQRLATFVRKALL